MSSTALPSEHPVERVAAARPPHNLWQVWMRFRRNKLSMLALAVIIVQLLIAIFAAQIAPYDPYKGDFAVDLAKAD